MGIFKKVFGSHPSPTVRRCDYFLEMIAKSEQTGKKLTEVEQQSIKNFINRNKRSHYGRN